MALFHTTNMEMVRVVFVFCVLVGICAGCKPTECTGTCRCITDQNNPGGLDASQTPQFVMLTFDDAVSAANFGPTFETLFTGAYKNPSGCNIGSTFFVSHEYNNYAQLHHLWRAGSEIAVHTITHETATEMWKSASYDRWMKEVVGMRDIISLYAQIPISDIKGFRAPFLQTAGDTTFEMLKNESFLYDSSMTTRYFAGLEEGTQPVWPFTLDYPFQMDCVIPPCPTKTYPGLWEVPLVSLFKPRVMITGQDPVMMPCSMADACLPYPETAEETFNFFKENFERYYLKNKAPFPVFLHESWLKAPERKNGYIKFLEYLLSQKDVYIVTVQEVLEFIKAPKPLENYQEKRCIKEAEPAKCSSSGTYCYFDETELGGPRVLFTCTPDCPSEYPWLEK